MALHDFRKLVEVRHGSHIALELSAGRIVHLELHDGTFSTQAMLDESEAGELFDALAEVLRLLAAPAQRHAGAASE